MRRLWMLLLVFSHFCNAQEDNSLIVTDNGLEMFAWDLDFVREAKQSIEISAVFLGGEIARELFQAIEARLEQVPTLQVYLLTSPILLEKQDWAMLARLQSTYPENFHVEQASTVALIWPDVAGIDNHAKMFIVDGKYFSTGGTNLDETQCSEGTWAPKKNRNKPPILSENLPAAMRDQDIVGSGPFAEELRCIFHKIYALWEHYNRTGIFEKDPEKFASHNHYFAITEQAVVDRFEKSDLRRTVEGHQIHMVFSGPHQKDNASTREYIRLIQQAKEEIIIANLYFCPVDGILQALMDAVNRGVKLTLLTNGVGEYSPEYTKYFCWANRIHYVPMLYGSTFHFWDAWNVGRKPIKKTRIFEYHVKDVLLHKKVMIVDGKHAIVGSYNLGFRSDMGDYEMIVKIHSREIAADLKKVHEKDLKFSIEITPSEACQWYFDPVKASLGEMQKRFHGLL